MTPRRDLDRKLIAAVDRLGRALRVARQQVATDHKLSLLQLQLLEQLSGRRACRVGELASELDVTQPTISDALAALRAKGAVHSAPDVTDKRAMLVSLTEAGEHLAAEVADDLAPLLDAPRIVSEPDQANALRVLLEEIRRFQERGIITVNRSCLTCRHYRGAVAGFTAAHCLLLDEPLGDADLRVDCPEHVPAAGVR